MQTVSVPTGHNCFTWAKQQLRDLNDPYIILPPNTLADWAFSATSRFLIDHQRTQPWYHNPFYVAGITGSVGIAAGLAASRKLSKGCTIL